MTVFVAEPFGGAAAQVLARAQDVLRSSAGTFITRFYETLESHVGPGTVLARLTPDEAAHLKERQAEHLRHLIRPDLTERDVLDRARRLGRVHAMVGVEIDWYAKAIVAYQRGILELLAAGHAPAGDEVNLQAIINQRLAVDLQGVLSGYRDDYDGQARATMAISQIAAEADTVSDLIRGTLDTLLAVDGLAVGWFGRPDDDGVFQLEVGAGDGADELVSGKATALTIPITTSRSDATGQGPTGRAWRSRAIERSDAYLTDPATAPWHHIGGRFGWRSSAAVPLTNGDGEVRAMLNLYAFWPGFFAYSTRLAFLTQLRRMLEPALLRLESHDVRTRAVRPFRERQTNIARLSSGDVHMVYQPVVSLPDGAVLKLEGLARLVDGDRLIHPGQFLPTLGDGELLRLFDLGLEQALTAMRRWEERGLTTGVSLNLPTSCLSDSRYVMVVARALDRHRTDPSRLTLELLETGSTNDEPRWHGQVLAELRALGVHLAEDDLGAGHSSLLRLQNVPFTEVKLDQQFIRETEDSPREGFGFVHPLTYLAHSLGLTVVMEGLETPGLIEAATILGADAGQGYAIARPMEADDVPSWAAGFHLSVDPAEPRTVLGALAAHLAWEYRAAAVRGSARLAPQAATDVCLLDPFIAALGTPGAPAAAAHRDLHVAALDDPGGEAHAVAWRRLTGLLRSDAADRWR